jgi:ribosomal-protein-alanine N-acetyltransferase
MWLKRELEIFFNNENITRNKNKIIYRNKEYTKKEWYGLTSLFKNADKRRSVLRNLPLGLNQAYLREMYSLNIKKHTFLGLVLPCTVFLLISLISKWVNVNHDNNPFISKLGLSETSFIFLNFLAIVFLLFALILLYMLVIKKKRIIYIMNGRKTVYQHIDYTDYRGIMDMLNQDYIFFKPIISERIIIRELTTDDIEDYFIFASSEVVHKYLSSEPIKAIEDIEHVIAKAQNQYVRGLIHKLGIIERSTNKLIGFIGLSNYDLTPTTCQIIYGIHEDYWGKGYVSEAVKEFVIYLQIQGKTLIIAGHVEENKNSGKVLLKCGFIRNPERDHEMIIHNVPKKIISYAIGGRKEK